MKSFVLFVLVTFVVVSALIQVNPTSKFFIDDAKRVRLFHGVNVVYKIPPYFPNLETFDPLLSLTDADIENLAAWGFNSVRLGMMWPGVEPAQGQYNQTYLSTMQSIVNKLGAKGIYSILDMHQDVWSPLFCGEGAPDWVITNLTTKPFLPFPEPVTFAAVPRDARGYPELSWCLKKPFFEYYFSDASCLAFQDLYDNKNGIQDALASFWQQVATVFHTNDYVLGYELINEPWAGDIYRDPKLILDQIHGYADKKNLAPMYAKLNSELRKVDNDHIIFFEPMVSDLATSGLEQGPGGPSYNDRQAYSYHVYCGDIDTHGDPKNIPICNAQMTLVYDERKSDYLRLGVGGFMTEFGAVSNSSSASENIDILADLADEFLQSWTYWQFKTYADPTTANPDQSEGFYYPNGDLQKSKVLALSRTYARAIAGVPISQRFNSTSGAFSFVYQIDTSISSPTEIFVATLHYAGGYSVTVTPASHVSVSSVTSDIIHIVPTAAAVQAEHITVIIAAS